MSSKPRIIDELNGMVSFSEPIWPDKSLRIQPGDLSRFVPPGNSIYGFDLGPNSDPITSAPLQEESGGTIYFGNDITKQNLQTVLEVLNIDIVSRDYAAFAAESDEPGTERYLTQIRFVSRFALKYIFGAIDDQEYDNFPQQKFSVLEAIWAFIENQKE